MSRLLSCTLLFGSLLYVSANAQSARINYSSAYPISGFSHEMYLDTLQADADTTFPNPKSVMYKSMMIPGWGQVVNKQIWKVPIIYGLLGGLASYSVWLTKQYHDYRAAYYNTQFDDFHFGPTPPYLQGVNSELLKTNRNTFRNRRDLMYVAIVAAYGLNILDAYVYAHMRSFDVTDDLSVRPSIKPSVMTAGTPGLTLSLELFNRTKAQ